MLRRFLNLLALSTILAAAAGAQQLTPHKLTYAPGASITLNLPASLAIDVAASGLHRVRFLTQSPDGRIFATGMWNLADNTQGSIFILEGWDAPTHRFTKVTTYLDHLRNPNNLAFWTDPATHQTWLYLPLTDRLERFPYKTGDEHPSGPAQTLIRFPDYGLNYKYGGWHLTRTVAIANVRYRTRVFVSVGSSCDYCKEREVARASIISMDPDGSHQFLSAYGLRNAVDLRFTPGFDGDALFATNMGADHLGTGEPEDTFFELVSRSNGETNDDDPCRPRPTLRPSRCQSHSSPNYGWPTCYFAHGKATLDTTPLPDMPAPGDQNTEAERPTNAGTPSHSRPADNDSVYGAQPGMAQQGTLTTAAGGRTNVTDPNANLGTVPAPLTDCSHVSAAYNTFPAHSSPLGLAYFGANNPTLSNSFLVALHGASRPRIGTGYKVVRFTPQDRTPQAFITGFLTETNGKPTVHGRPCGILRLAPDTFLLTDDKLGLVYYIHPRT